MRVCHLKRTFLGRTETHVYWQIVQQVGLRHLVLSRDLRDLRLFPGVEVRAFSELPPSSAKHWANWLYRRARIMARVEREFYKEAVSAFEPQVLHAHYAVDAAYFSRVTSSCEAPFIVSCYGYDVSSFPQRIFGFGGHYIRPALNRARLVLAMSQDMKETLVRLGVSDEKILIHHPNGVDLNRFAFRLRLPPVARPVRVLTVASLEERKGLVYLIRAWQDVVRRYPMAHLRIVGDGQLRKQLAAEVGRLGLAGSIEMAGQVAHTDLVDQFEWADLFCLPSVTAANGDKEGIPSVLVQAQACGLPTVSTWHAGIPEVVIDGGTGYLVPERDSIRLAQRLIELIANPDLWAAIGSAGRKHVEQQFDARVLAKRLVEIYQMAAERHQLR